MTKAIDNEKCLQRQWWDSHSRRDMLDNRGYIIGDPSENIYGTPPETVWDMFRRGDGNELAGKMRALHSSSALGLNVFGHWVTAGDCGPLQRSLGLDAPIEQIWFEKKFENGLGGRTNPNLDMALYLADGSITAIESKYLEPLSSHMRGLKSAYFEHGGRSLTRWSDVGLDRHQQLAETLRTGEDRTYKRLHAEQLLKHALGLGNERTQRQDAPHRPSRLIYLYFEHCGTAAEEHRADIGKYAKDIQHDWLDFRAISYQDLFHHLVAECAGLNAHDHYLEYLGDRYFNRPEQSDC